MRAQRVPWVATEILWIFVSGPPLSWNVAGNPETPHRSERIAAAFAAAVEKLFEVTPVNADGVPNSFGRPGRIRCGGTARDTWA